MVVLNLFPSIAPHCTPKSYLPPSPSSNQYLILGGDPFKKFNFILHLPFPSNFAHKKISPGNFQILTSYKNVFVLQSTRS